MPQLQFQEYSEESSYEALFAEVILPIAVANTFTYRIPQILKADALPGKRVIVQFGKKKIFTALIAEIHNRAPVKYAAKYILDVLDKEPIILPLQLEFWKWVATYYCCTIGEVMDAALPANMKLASETRIVLNPEKSEEFPELSMMEDQIMEVLELGQALTISEIIELLGRKTVFPVIKSLYEKGYIHFQEDLDDAYKLRKESYVLHNFDEADKTFVKDLFDKLEKSAPRQSDLLLAYFSIREQGKAVLKRKLLKKAGTSPAVLNALKEKNLLIEFEEETDRIIIEDGAGWDYTLNPYQQKALDEIEEEYKTKNVVLLHGVTGSGKTHIFMQLMDEVLKEGRQALYLVPEIALTAQLIQRLRAKYGQEIGIYHSKFNPNERVEIWNKVLNGTYKIILGVRSALFLPFSRLGLMIIDEEHEPSFKQFEPAPRYHARDAGIYLMQLSGGKTLLGTATPSFESYSNALAGKYGFVKLQKRFGDMKMPEMMLADLREETKKKLMKSHFSSVLYLAMQETLKQKSQVILFQNRRGYAPLLECTSCGWTPMCQNCDISLTYHQQFKEIICHYCGYKEVTPKKCAACGNYTLKMLGFGTEKIEDELNIFFPEYNSLRMDQDTTRGKNAYSRIIQSFEDGEAQILVGTQMVTKGLDFENVQLVGILNADQMLRYPDFRAIERSYQMISQVAGRAGRKNKQGSVIIQTYNTTHPLFSYVMNHDYEGFYASHIQERLDYQYPPYFRLIKLIFRHEDVEKVQKSANYFAERLRLLFDHRVLGPEFPVIARIRGKYAMNIMLKFERANFNMADAKAHLMKEVDIYRSDKTYNAVRIIVDVDPH